LIDGRLHDKLVYSRLKDRLRDHPPSL